MLQLAVKAGLPLIGVHTDDLPNFPQAFHALVGKKILRWSGKSLSDVLESPWLHYIVGEVRINEEGYKKLVQAGKTLVVVNPPPDVSLFDAGSMPTPTTLLREYLKSEIPATLVEPALKVLNGLSLRAASETVALTNALYDEITSVDQIRTMRMKLSAGIPGLYPLSSDTGFYVENKKLEEWLALNKPYFIGDYPAQVRPRGLLLAGTPGVGKTLAAKRIASVCGVPLFRLDVATTLTKYIGESEARVSRSLQQIEKEEPCVLLFDEVEKVFQSLGESSGVIDRILSQLLWWLQNHQSRVLTVMTTNNLKVIPPELYRTGRIDMVLELHPMHISEAKVFALRVAFSILSPLSGKEQAALSDQIVAELEERSKGTLSHAEASDVAYTVIKRGGWLLKKYS